MSRITTCCSGRRLRAAAEHEIVGQTRESRVQPFRTAESAASYVKATKLEGDTFELDIADGVTFAGQPDVIGAGMAVVLHAILAQGFEPDGFEQRPGYRAYRYKPIE